MDAAQQQLASNYARLRAVCEAAGAQHADDSVYGSFQEAVGEWNRKLQHGHVAAAGGVLHVVQAEHRKCADVTADTRQMTGIPFCNLLMAFTQTITPQADSCPGRTSTLP